VDVGGDNELKIDDHICVFMQKYLFHRINSLSHKSGRVKKSTNAHVYIHHTYVRAQVYYIHTHKICDSMIFLLN